MEKYEFTGKEKEWAINGAIYQVRQIKAIKDIAEHNIVSGTIGGWMCSHSRLSHEGSCWIDEETVLSGVSSVSGDVLIKGSTIDKSKIDGNGIIYDSFIVYSRFKECHLEIQKKSNMYRIEATKSQMNLWESNFDNAVINESYVTLGFSTVESERHPLIISVKSGLMKRFAVVESEVFLKVKKPEDAKVLNSAKIHYVNVTSNRPLTKLVGFESFTLKHLNVEDVSLVFGENNSSKSDTASVIRGTRGEEMELKNSSIELIHSYVIGRIKLEGVLRLLRSRLYHGAGILSNTESLITIDSVQLHDVATIKNFLATPQYISNVTCQDDEEIVLR